MKLLQWIIVVLLFAGSTTLAQTTRSTQPTADVRSFQITPAAPPQPALKYQLLYNDLADRLPGDASVLYLDAVLLMGPDAKAKSQKAVNLRRDPTITVMIEDGHTYDTLRGVSIDGTANTIALEDYAALPVTMRNVRPAHSY